MTDGVNDRGLVLDILLAVTKGEAYSHVALSNVLEKYQYLEKQDRAFITRVSEGTLERMIELDYIIDRFASVPVRRMKPVIRCILRSAVYEMRYMDSIPFRATCDEAVKLARSRGFGRLTGFVNGVLRSIGRGLSELKLPERSEDETAYLSVRYSMPEWIIRLWQADYTMEQIEEMCRVFLLPSAVTVRTDTGRITPEELKRRLTGQKITVRQDPRIPEALHLSGVDYLGALPEFTDGLFYVQDVSSMQAVLAAGITDGSTVLDVCGAPGGKSVHAAQLLKETGRVITRDVSAYKVSLIQENIRRNRVKNMQAEQWDARVFDEAMEGQADVVIADLPCSGLGVLGRKADIKYRMSREQLTGLAALQREILSVVHRYVRDGGVLLYSTCTIDRLENEDNVSWFLQNFPGWNMEYQEQILPDESGRDGFFIARLRKGNL